LCPFDLGLDDIVLSGLACSIGLVSFLECISSVNGLRREIDPDNIESIVLFLDAAKAFSAEILDKFRQRAPTSRVEVNMVLIRDICLVEPVRMDLLLLVTSPEEPKKGRLELLREVVDSFLHIADVVDTTSTRLRNSVFFEGLSIPTLLLAGREDPGS
jgi:hypothetical protein